MLSVSNCKHHCEGLHVANFFVLPATFLICVDHLCFAFFLQLVLLGSEEGLYSLSLDSPGKHTPRMLPGIERAFQIDIVRDLNLVVMIAGTVTHNIRLFLFQVRSRRKIKNRTH